MSHRHHRIIGREHGRGNAALLHAHAGVGGERGEHRRASDRSGVGGKSWEHVKGCQAHGVSLRLEDWIPGHCRKGGARDDSCLNTTLVKDMAAAKGEPRIDLVHLINRRSRYTSSSKDFEFSRATVNELWEAGREAARKSFAHLGKLKGKTTGDGIRVFDVALDGGTRA